MTGAWIVGHGRDTRLVWDGPEGQPLWLDHGVAHSRYAGLSFDGRGKATVGLHHRNGAGGFETEVDLRHMAFRNFTDTGLLASGAPATAEVVVENSLFEDCRRGIAFLNFNDYDWTIDGCEFRRCQTGIQCDHGNTYIRNSHFEGCGVACLVVRSPARQLQEEFIGGLFPEASLKNLPGLISDRNVESCVRHVSPSL